MGHKKGKKGDFIADENWNRNLASSVTNADFGLSYTKVSDRNIGMSDERLIEEYGKSNVILTNDRSQYKDARNFGEAAGYIQFSDKNTTSIESFENYCSIVEGVLSESKSVNDFKGMITVIGLNGIESREKI